MRNYYETLGVDRNIPQKDLKKHFYRLAKKYHPDTNGNQKPEIVRRFKEITAAYNALSTHDKRKRYDMGGRGGNFVYSGGFSSRSTVPKKELILAKLRTGKDFSITLFADELRVSYLNLEKIIMKFFTIMDFNAGIENERVLFKN
jgi:DnaJ-class molecular chaperone